MLRVVSGAAGKSKLVKAFAAWLPTNINQVRAVAGFFSFSSLSLVLCLLTSL